MDDHGSGKDSPGTSLLAAPRCSRPFARAWGREAEVTYSADGTGAAGADAVVVVVGEQPYAEMKGDRLDLTLDAADRLALANARASNRPVIVVIISGRPLDIAPVIGDADAVVAAWLPGTEGGGVADVLFGDYRPTGKLSFTWPRSVDGRSQTAGTRNALFPFGFGLTY